MTSSWLHDSNTDIRMYRCVVCANYSHGICSTEVWGQTESDIPSWLYFIWIRQDLPKLLTCWSVSLSNSQLVNCTHSLILYLFSVHESLSHLVRRIYKVFKLYLQILLSVGNLPLSAFMIITESIQLRIDPSYTVS
jgi:hypothetical protein